MSSEYFSFNHTELTAKYLSLVHEFSIKDSNILSAINSYLRLQYPYTLYKAIKNQFNIHFLPSVKQVIRFRWRMTNSNLFKVRDSLFEENENIKCIITISEASFNNYYAENIADITQGKDAAYYFTYMYKQKNGSTHIDRVVVDRNFLDCLDSMKTVCMEKKLIPDMILVTERVNRDCILPVSLKRHIYLDIQKRFKNSLIVSFFGE